MNPSHDPAPADLPVLELSPADFRARFLLPKRPVVLAHAAKHMPALNLWSPEWFRSHHGQTTVKVEGQPMTVNALIDAVLASSEAAPGPYLHNCYLQVHFPQLVQQIQPPLAHATPNWLIGRGFPKHPPMPSGLTGLFIGGAGTGFPVLHQDRHHTTAFVTQIYGHKDVVLIAPGCEDNLYLDPKIPTWSQVDPYRPDLKAYPRFANVSLLHHRLYAGQTLVIPGGWWHTTHMDAPSISISTNHADASNWRAFSNSLADSLQGLAKVRLLLHLRLLGLHRALFRRQG